MIKPLKSAALFGAAVSALLVTAPSAHAALTLTLSETGFGPLTVVDTLNTGALSFFGTYGDFQTNFVAGLSNKLTALGLGATLQIESLDVKNLSSTGTKTLSLTLTDDGYTFPSSTGGAVQLNSSFGGTLTGPLAGDTVTFQSSVVSPAVTDGLQSFSAPTTTPGTVSFSSDAVPVVFARPASFDLQNVTTLSLSQGGEQSNLSGTTSVTAVVPEPVSLASAALAALLVTTRRRRRV